MLKITILVISSFVTLCSTEAQEKIEVHGVSPDLYLQHTVAPHETWYSVGRLFNVNPKALAAYNKTGLNKTLAVNQQLRIPLSADNFSQDDRKAVAETFVPLYHTVQDREWMYRISVNHNKVPVASLEKWNGVTNGQLRPGMNLVVGYLKVKKESSLSSTVSNNQKTEPSPAPLQHPAKTEKSVVAKESSVPETPVDKPRPETKEETRTPVVEASTTSAPRRGGYFRSLYHESNSGTAGNAGIFRSTSGWNDGKYYALMNNVPVGTIVKVTFSSTNKSIYAKVLGQLPEMRESMGLTLRLSDAAAAELGTSMNKFYVDVRY